MPLTLYHLGMSQSPGNLTPVLVPHHLGRTWHVFLVQLNALELGRIQTGDAVRDEEQYNMSKKGVGGPCPPKFSASHP